MTSAGNAKGDNSGQWSAEPLQGRGIGRRLAALTGQGLQGAYQMEKSRKVRGIAVAAVGAAGVVGVGEMVASAASFGPQSWSVNQTTGRYWQEPKTHHMSISDCGNQTQTLELRADIIDDPDIGYGNFLINCNTTQEQYSGRNTYDSQYRGFFIQSRTEWYCTITDK